ncbi:hypothetical protein V2G26_015613 [Clonostachys chloroleuca]
MEAPPPYTSATGSSSSSRTRSSLGRMRSMADYMLRSRVGGRSNDESTNPPEPSSATLPSYDSRSGTLTRSVDSRRISDDSSTRLSMLRSPPGTMPPSTTSSANPIQDRKLRLDELKKEIEAVSQPTKRSNDGLFKEACSTDLLFLIDTTSSMHPYIDAAKKQVKDIMEDIDRTFLKEAEIRMAVVGYRDHTDKPNIEFQDFTTDVDLVRSFIDKLKATGGDDFPEDVLGGLDKVVNANWKNQTRCVIHIGDAPPHGKIFNIVSYTDRWATPGTEPHKLTYQPLLKKMIMLNLNYCFLRIQSHTDIMSYLFLKEYQNASAQCKLHVLNSERIKLVQAASSTTSRFRGGKSSLAFEESELGTSYSALRHLVVQSVASSASRTAIRLSESISKNGGKLADSTALANCPSIVEEEESEKELVMENVVPDWDTPSWFNETLTVEGFSPDVVRAGARTLSDMMMHDDHIELSTMELGVRRRSKPFSQGALRVAAYARTAASTNHFVVKSFKKDGKHLAHLAEDMRCQALCKAFALEFNNLVSPQHAVDFIITTCLKAATGKDGTSQCMSLEPYIKGQYVKYNNNSGWVNHDLPAGDATNMAAQAFSHFTFERSWGQILVCDLQGVGGLLTDPAIHTADANRFRLADTNLNREGFKFFFSTHACNDVCRTLGLISTADMVMRKSLTFREKWPAVESTVYCSNKLCGKIVPAAGARKADEYPNCHWCDVCWPQLESTKVRWMCLAPGPDHEYDVSRFFYESQGRAMPRKCPEHREADEPAARPAAVGGAVWARMNNTAKQKNISGRSW